MSRAAESPLPRRRVELDARKEQALALSGIRPRVATSLAVLPDPGQEAPPTHTVPISAEVVPSRSALVQDKELVARAVERIREIITQTTQRGLEEVGSYLFREFYGSDPALYRSTHPNKHVSLQLLMDRSQSLDLPITKAFLSRAIKMAALQGQLPKHSRFAMLPTSHRQELLRVRCPEKVDQLAARAFDSKMSVPKLRDLVNKEVERTKSTRGRKLVPEVIKSLRACVREIRDDETGRLTFHREEIDALSDEQLIEAQSLIGTLARRVEELMRLLG